MADGDFIPDDFDIQIGTWGTDAVLDKTVFVSADASIKLVSAHTEAARITSTPKPLLVSPGDVVVGDWIIAQGDITAGNHLRCYFAFYDSAMTYIGSVMIFDSELPAVIGAAPYNFYRISGSATCPAGSTNAVLVFDRAAVGFDAWLDTMGIRKVQPGFMAFLSASTTKTTGSVIPLDAEKYDDGSWFDAANNRAVIPMDGTYTFCALVRSGDDISANEYIKPYFSIYDGSAYVAKTGNKSWSIDGLGTDAQVTYTGKFLRGEQVSLAWEHNHGSAITVLGHASLTYTWMSGVKI
jgi:hypothetical protein